MKKGVVGEIGLLKRHKYVEKSQVYESSDIGSVRSRE